MCYYYTPELFEDIALMKRFRAKAFKKAKAPVFSKYYTNGFNHEFLPVITQEESDTVRYFSWGLVPGFIKDMAGAKDISNKTLNARSETIFTTNSYKNSIISKRCLIPATGFFEWHTIGKDKYPYYIQVREEGFPDGVQPFCFGGIYNSWTDKATGETLDTFSLVTTQANGLLEFIHNSAKRMPLILSIEDEANWLDPNLNIDDISRLMQPFPTVKMIAYSVSKFITSRNQTANDPAVVEGYDYNLEAVPPVVSWDVIESFSHEGI